MPILCLGLGTNLGDRQANLQAAMAAINGLAPITARSRLYETAPLYVTDQPSFYNMALRAECDLPPLALLDRLKDLEERIGRIVTFRYGPRVIDLDILLYGDLVLDTPRLTIPHPRLPERHFALAPLADVAAELIHPQTGQSIRSMLDALPAPDDLFRVVDGVF